MGSFDIANILQSLVTVLVPMLLSLTIHEYAHGLSAYMLGDDTAKLMGHLTLNPISHIDPIGTLLLPAAIVILNAGSLAVPFFGWAKPVPFNPLRFSRNVPMSRGILLTAAAGPASNLVMAILCTGLFAVFYHTGVSLPKPVNMFLVIMIQINLVLCLFNLIPIYPLDGQKVLTSLLGSELGPRFDEFSRRFGMFFLIMLIMMGGSVIRTPMNWLFVVILKLFQIPI